MVLFRYLCPMDTHGIQHTEHKIKNNENYFWELLMPSKTFSSTKITHYMYMNTIPQTMNMVGLNLAISVLLPGVADGLEVGWRTEATEEVLVKQPILAK